MRRTLIVVAVACLALLAVSVATAKDGGNVANAKLCQKGGWMNLVRADGTTFASQDECVSYGAQGGTISPPSHQPRTGEEVCVANGGFYQLSISGAHFWICDGWVVTNFDAQVAALDEACRFDLGDAYDSTFQQGDPQLTGLGITDCYRKI
jgi:hypothetical protein